MGENDPLTILFFSFSVQDKYDINEGIRALTQRKVVIEPSLAIKTQR